MRIECKEFPALYACMKEEKWEILYDHDDGIIVRNPQTEISYAYASSEACAKKLFKIVSAYNDDVVICGDDLQKELCNENQYEGGEPFYYASYMKTIPQIDDTTSISYRILDKTFINQVIQHYSYKECANEVYISQCIKEGMIGAFKDDQLVGFAGIHDSGSMGLLEVFPSYQKHGIGSSLVKRMIVKQLEQNQIPFSEIFEHNQTSIRLVKKVGMELSGNTAIWCCKIL